MSGTKDALAELGLAMEDDSMETAEKAESTAAPLDPYTHSKQLERQFEFLSIQEVPYFPLPSDCCRGATCTSVRLGLCEGRAEEPQARVDPGAGGGATLTLASICSLS